MRMPQPAIFWIVSGVIFVAAFITFLKLRQGRGGSFIDVLKNPESWGNLDRTRAEVEKESKKAEQWNERQLSTAVEKFVFDAKTKNDAWIEYKVLSALGAKTHPHLLALLKDESRKTKLVKPTGKDLVPEAPFNRACDLLDDEPPAEAALALAPYLDEASNEIRKSAALVIGATGTIESVMPLGKVFADENEYVRSYGIMGVQRAVKRNGLVEDCRRELFPEIQRLLEENKNADVAAELLLELDPSKAMAFFHSEAFFSPESQSLRQALKAMAGHKMVTPRENLLTLVQALETGIMEYPKNCLLSEALRMLGLHRNADDLALLNRHLDHLNSKVAEGAAAGLLFHYGIEDFAEGLWAKQRQRGSGALTQPQRHWLAVTALDNEVNNGGFAQYFFNSSGDDWKDALAGLEAMQMKQRAALLAAAVGKFGASSPSAERNERQQQLSKLIRRDEGLFNPFDDQYYALKEVVEVQATRYVLQNPEAFR